MNSPTPRPKIGFVSLGCPKALVDSEVILTQLKSEGYDTTSAYGDADAVVVNTCGFLDSAREESLDAIGEALKENGKVIVTGCLGAEADIIRARFPNVAAITGAHAFDDVARAVHAVAPPPPADPFADLVPPQGVKLTPKHYAYLKISEGCDHSCSFCIIPQLRGGLVSRPLDQILAEAEKLKAAGVKELLVVAQDTSAYGLDLKYPTVEWNGRTYRSDLEGLCQALGELGVWVRLHYVYPYPHVDKIIPLMAEGKILPYLDIPFQHASPKILKAMRRPANEDRVLERIAKWREICPDLTLRSTFVVGFPGETEDDFEHLLSWVEAAKLSRVGVFAYENVAGAPARALDGHVAEDVKQDRRERLMALTQKLSSERLRAKIGKTYEILIDQVRPDGVTVGRTPGDAPEVDGLVYVRGLKVAPGDLARVRIVRTEAYDLWGEPLERLRAAPLRPGHRRLIGRH